MISHVGGVLPRPGLRHLAMFHCSNRKLQMRDRTRPTTWQKHLHELVFVFGPCREAAEMLMALKPTSPGNNSSSPPGSRHASSETHTDSSGSGTCRQACTRAQPASHQKSPRMASPAMKQTKRPKSRSPTKQKEHLTAAKPIFSLPHAPSKR